MKAADIATFIVQKKDLGTKAPLVELVEEKRHHLGTGKKFWSAIGGLQTIACKCYYKFYHSKPNHEIKSYHSKPLHKHKSYQESNPMVWEVL